jgi:hypothetical protein
MIRRSQSGANCERNLIVLCSGCHHLSIRKAPLFAAELAKVARRNQEHFESANWLHRAKTTPTQQFKEEVEKYLTGSSKPSELIYFKVYKSRVPVIEQALEIAARMLGSDKSRGYCLEMICVDFLAGAGCTCKTKTKSCSPAYAGYSRCFPRPNSAPS